MQRVTRNAQRNIGWLLAAYLALALAYGLAIPPFEGLDEVEHFDVACYVADTGSLPVTQPHDTAPPAYHYRQEASQPPLYYLLAGGLLHVTRIPTDDAPGYQVPNPYVTCGTETIRSNKAVLRHDPFAEAFPWHSALLALHVLRGLSSLLQAFTVAGVYAIARRVFPGQASVPLLAAALTAFNPQFLIVASSANNDNAATPVITWGLYLAVCAAQDGLSFRRALALGVLSGLAALSKLTGLLLLPLAALALASAAWRERRWWPAAAWLLLVAAIAAAVGGWWYVRNWQLYGDPSGLAPMLDIVGRRGPVPPVLLLAELGLVFRSYWGQFPCAFFDSGLYYAAWGLITVLGLAGALWGLRRERGPRAGVYVLLAWLLLVLAGWLRWNLTTPAPGGRLLFAAMGAVSSLLAYGLAWRWPRLGYGAVLGLAGVGVLALVVWVRPLFAPPPMVDAASARPAHALQARFGDEIGLLGYDVQAGELGPGRYVDITLYWRALQALRVDYSLALQLAALAPGDTRTLLNFNTWPGGGNLPTAAWPLGPVIVDRCRVPLPLDTGLTQAWRLQVAVYDARSGVRLPLWLDDRAAGDALGLGEYRVAGTRQPGAALPEEARLAEPVTFDESIVLTHAQVDEQADSIQVRLAWQSQRPTSHTLTVFVHAYDAAGKLVATGDGPPLNGNFPTRLWQPGDQVLDVHSMVMPPDLSLDKVRIAVGLYRPEDGVRLPAVQGASRLQDDAVTIWLPSPTR